MQKGRLIALSCIIILSACLPTLAQEEKPQQTSQQKPQQPNIVAMMRSPMMREAQKRGGKIAMRSFWDGKGSNLMFIQMLNEKDVRDAWGVTDEQHKQVQSSMSTGMMKNPEFMKLAGEMGKLSQGGKLFSEDGNPEDQQKFGELQEKMTSLMLDSVSKEVDAVMTPKQKRDMQEFQLATMSEMPIVTPNMFEALDLSDEQKGKMETIRKELSPDFDKLTDEFMDTQMKIMDKVWTAVEKDGVQLGDGQKKTMESIQAITKKLLEEDPEFRRLQEEIGTKGKIFVTNFKIKMFDVLTDEQLARLQEIVDNPPEYVKNLIDKMKKMMGGDARTDSTKAFMDAWKPGETVPEEYKQQRQRKAFPVKENY